MKKVFCIIIAIILALLYISAISASDSVVSISGSAGSRGNLVDVRINVTGEADNLTIILEYDRDAFILYEVKDAGILQNANHGKNAETEKYHLSWGNGGKAYGTVAVLTFLIRENAEFKNYAVSATAEGFKIVEGYIGVTEASPGDVTDDGTLDEDDAEGIRKYSANWTGDYNVTSGDVNGDGKVNLADAILIARRATGWQGYMIDAAREVIDPGLEIEFDYDESGDN